jgi:MerR family transcriptional regulator, light-induced transcriptional regulator
LPAEKLRKNSANRKISVSSAENRPLSQPKVSICFDIVGRLGKGNNKGIGGFCMPECASTGARGAAWSDRTPVRDASMLEDQFRDQETLSDRSAIGLTGFASDVVSMLLTRGVERPTQLDPGLLDRFVAALLSYEAHRTADLRQEFRRLRVTPNALAELYIPAAARRFGEAWMDDTMNFCDVTLATSRLQSLLHELTSGFFDEERRGTGEGTVLVVVPAGEQHMLGGLSLAWQLRRRGISVCLQMSPSLAALRKLVENRRFDGAFVSVASDRHFDSLKTLVSALKGADSTSRLSVVVGGPVTTFDAPDIATVGADLVTSDVDAALERMGVLPARLKAGRF